MQATNDRYKNKGAYIVLEPPDFDNPVFHSFAAVTPRPKVLDTTYSIIVKKNDEKSGLLNFL